MDGELENLGTVRVGRRHCQVVHDAGIDLTRNMHVLFIRDGDRIDAIVRPLYSAKWRWATPRDKLPDFGMVH